MIYWENFWRHRHNIAILNCLIAGVTTGALVTLATSLFAWLFVLIQGFRVLHSLRIFKGRLEPSQLRRKGHATEMILSLALLSTVLAWVLYEQFGHMLNIILTAAVVQLLVSVVILVKSISSLRKTKFVLPAKFLSDQELPTLSVAIPARNETSELTESLHALLKSDYPKLEILVLDDCSQDKTSDIIRSFAHKGVRFVKGTEPREGWLAKTQAYSQLLENASGDYVLFCGVDVRFGKGTLRNLMNSMLTHELSMISVLPNRSVHNDKNFLLQPMRYWRELAIPRVGRKFPPALSTCWIAQKHSLKKLGAFDGLRQAIRPEYFIARYFDQRGLYKFIRANKDLEISSAKTHGAQWQTAIRTRYPELRRRPEAIMFSIVSLVFFLLGPIAISIYSIMIFDGVLFLITSISVWSLLIVNSLVYFMTTGAKNLQPIIIFPLSVVLEIIAVFYSMWAYEFSSVVWKGRNICLPVLRSHPSLPKLN